MLAAETGPFIQFGVAHIVALIATLFAPAALSVLVRKVDSASVSKAVCWALAVVLVGNELVHYVHSFWTFGLVTFLQKSLPLHICDVAVFLTAYSLVKRNQLVFEIALFLGVAGTLQGVITPDIDTGFPSYYFIRFFITHCGIVTGVLLLTWGLKMRPRFKGIFITFFIANVYAIFVGLANWALGPEANYMFLRHAPAGESPFFFAPWPWYILVLEPISLGFIFIVYAPYALAARLRARKGDQP